MLGATLERLKWRSFVIFMIAAIAVVVLSYKLLGRESVMFQIVGIMVPNGAILAFFIWKLYGKVSYREVLLPFPGFKDLGRYLLVFAILLLTTCASASVLFQMLIVDGKNPEEFLQKGFSMTNSIEFYCKIFLIILIGPIAEELFCRGFLLEKWKKYGVKKAIFFSSILFSLGHGGIDPTKILMGTILSIFYLERGISIGIYYHILNNLFALFLMFFAEHIHVSPEFYSNIAAYWKIGMIYLILLGVVYYQALRRWRYSS